MGRTGRYPKGTKTPTPVQRAFLDAYAQMGNITAAAKAAGVDPCNHRKNWVKDPVYLELFREADEQATEILEAEAIRRASRGTDKPIFHKGKQVGSVREYSDPLLMFLLKARRPAVYRENTHHTHSGSVELKMYGQDAPVDRV